VSDSSAGAYSGAIEVDDPASSRTAIVRVGSVCVQEDVPGRTDTNEPLDLWHRVFLWLVLRPRRRSGPRGERERVHVFCAAG